MDTDGTEVSGELACWIDLMVAERGNNGPNLDYHL